MASANDVVQAMQKAGKQAAGDATSVMLTGTVTSLKPLRITTQAGLVIEEAFLTLSPFCLKTDTNGAEHTHPQNVGIALETFELWRGLREGDVVYMISLDQNQQYYVLHRKYNGVISE